MLTSSNEIFSTKIFYDFATIAQCFYSHSIILVNLINFHFVIAHTCVHIWQEWIRFNYLVVYNYDKIWSLSSS